MKSAKIIYLIAWIIPASLAILYLANIIGKGGALASNQTLSYMLSIITITLSLFTAYMAMKMFSLEIIKHKIQNQDKQAGLSAYNMLCSIRLITILSVIIIDLATFYLLGSTSAAYLAAIMMITLLFCWPRQSEYDNLAKKPEIGKTPGFENK